MGGEMHSRVSVGCFLRLVGPIATACSTRARPLGRPLEGRMADIDWKPLPTGLWTPPQSLRRWETYSFRRLRTLACQPGRSARRQTNRANGRSSRRALPTPSRRPKRRRSSKRRRAEGTDRQGLRRRHCQFNPAVIKTSPDAGCAFRRPRPHLAIFAAPARNRRVDREPPGVAGILQIAYSHYVEDAVLQRAGPIISAPLNLLFFTRLPRHLN
jgi:hypothetical protein